MEKEFQNLQFGENIQLDVDFNSFNEKDVFTFEKHTRNEKLYGIFIAENNISIAIPYYISMHKIKTNSLIKNIMKIEELNEQAEKVTKLVSLLLQTFPEYDVNEAYKLTIMAGLQDAYRKGFTDNIKEDPFNIEIRKSKHT